MNIGYQSFNGEIQTDSKGNKKFKFELVVKNESGQMTIVGGSTTSKLKDVLGTANKLYDMNSTHLYDIVGKKINLKCTNYEAVKDDDAKAYTYRAEVIGEADHKTEGI